MGTILASKVITDARRLLQDVSNVATRWDDPTLLAGLNEGQRVLVSLKHDANTVTETVDVVAGDTRQMLSDNSVAFVRVTRNMGADGTKPGRAITGVSKENMDFSDPEWGAAKTAKAAFHFIFDPNHEREFHIWPPIEGKIELVHVAIPAEVTLGTAISLDDIYAAALTAYVVYYGLAQDMDAAPNRELARTWFSQFAALVSGKVQSEESLKRG